MFKLLHHSHFPSSGQVVQTHSTLYLHEVGCSFSTADGAVGKVDTEEKHLQPTTVTPPAVEVTVISILL